MAIALQHFGGLTNHFLAPVAGDFFESLIHIQNDSLQVGDHNGLHRLVNRDHQPLTDFLRRLAAGNIRKGAEDAPGLTVFIPFNDLGGRKHPKPVTLPGSQPVFHPVFRYLVGNIPAKRLPDRFPVVRVQPFRPLAVGHLKPVRVITQHAGIFRAGNDFSRLQIDDVVNTLI